MGSERIKEWTQTDWTQTRSVKIKERQRWEATVTGGLEKGPVSVSKRGIVT